MQSYKNYLKIIPVIILGIIFQLFFCLADIKDTPNKAVVEFSKAYFSLDESMAERICKDRLIKDDINVVDKYINSVAKQARERGFNKNYLKSIIYHIRTETISKDNSNAEIRLTCIKKTSINPLYTVVARIFNIGNTYKIDQTFNLVKEDDKWKLCESIYSLPG